MTQSPYAVHSKGSPAIKIFKILYQFKFLCLHLYLLAIQFKTHSKTFRKVILPFLSSFSSSSTALKQFTCYTFQHSPIHLVRMAFLASTSRLNQPLIYLFFFFTSLQIPQIIYLPQFKLLGKGRTLKCHKMWLIQIQGKENIDNTHISRNHITILIVCIFFLI